MKRIYYFISIAVFTLVLASCGKVEVSPVDQAQTGRLTIVARTEGCVDTKTSLSGDDESGYDVLWSEGDELSTKENYKFILTEGAGTMSGTFVAEDVIEDGIYDIFYATTGKTLGNRSIHKGWGSISSVPMKATMTIEDGEVTFLTDFTNMCGLLRLTLRGSGTVKNVKVIDDEPLHGRIERINDDGSVVVEYSDYLDEYTLTQDCGEGVELSEEGVDFYFPVPPGEYRGVRIEVTDFSDHTVTKTMKQTSVLTIARAEITPVRLTVSGLDISPLPTGALEGEFTVKDPDGVPDSGDERKVHFAKGNLYWNGNSFRFEEEQNDYPNSKSQNHIGHFCWNRSASESLSRGCYDKKHVLFTNNPDNPELANAYFTVNGVSGRYRALSFGEWSYLMDHHQHSFASVEGIRGIVIAPDGASLTSGKESYSKAELKNNNLVFLPATGYFDNLWIKRVVDSGQQGYYLSSQPNNNYLQAYAVWFSTIQRRLTKDGYPSVDWGCAIRLVTPLGSNEPLDSSDIEKPEEGDDYDWE